MELNEDGDSEGWPPTDGTLGGRGDLPNPSGSSDTVFDYTDADCPPECCVDENCYWLRDHTGFEVLPDEEIMLVFGGMVIRDKKDPNGN